MNLANSFLITEGELTLLYAERDETPTSHDEPPEEESLETEPTEEDEDE
jgi:hypothetical protein